MGFQSNNWQELYINLQEKKMVEGVRTLWFLDKNFYFISTDIRTLQRKKEKERKKTRVIEGVWTCDFQAYKVAWLQQFLLNINWHENVKEKIEPTKYVENMFHMN